MIASRYGHADVVDALLQHGANMDLQNYVSAQYIMLLSYPCHCTSLSSHYERYYYS